jgi:hypothetical protein
VAVLIVLAPANILVGIEGSHGWWWIGSWLMVIFLV